MRKFVVSASLFILACSQGAAPKAGANLVSPFSLAATKVGTQNFLYVLNAAAFGEYSLGSLLGYSVGSDGLKTLRHVVDVPAYGTQIAANANGTLLATGYIGDTGKISLYTLDTSGFPTFASEVLLPQTGSLSSLFFFTYAGGEYLAVAQNSNGVGGKTHVWRVSNNVLIPKFTLPDDLEGFGSTENIGFAAPVFDGTRFLAFPSTTASALGKFTISAKDFSVSNWDKIGDVRAFSAAVVDFSKLGDSLNLATAYVPMIVQIGDTPDTKVFRTYFSAATLSTDSACNPNQIFLADDSSGIIWRSANWNGISSASFAASTFSGKLDMNVTFERYSTLGDMPSRSQFSSNVLSMGFAKSGSVCIPFWLRSEARVSGEGNARSWIQWISGTDPTQPIVKEFSHRGVVSSATLGEFLYAVSFSRDALLALKYTGSDFSEIQ